MFRQWVGLLEKEGWKITMRETEAAVPEEISDRYPAPAAWAAFIAPVSECVSGDGQVRFLTFEDYQTQRDGFRWNEPELRSTEAAGNDHELRAAVTGFWNYHLPIVHCTGDPYAYYAIDTQFGSVVYGEAPEFETAEVAAESFEQFIQKLIDGAIKL